MSECCETFEMRGLKGLDLQRFVYEEHDRWSCEQCTCGSNSPGPVADDEELIFLLINPTHFDEVTGQLSPQAFQEVHNRDLSLIRARYANDREVELTRHAIINSAMNRVPPKIREVELLARADAASIRSEADEVDRFFGIYDTPLPDRPSHASVFTRPDVLDDKRLKMVAKQKLHSVFSKRVEPIARSISSETETS